MFSGHSSPLLHLCHLLVISCFEVCVSCKTSSIVIQLAECDQDGKLCNYSYCSRYGVCMAHRQQNVTGSAKTGHNRAFFEIPVY